MDSKALEDITYCVDLNLSVFRNYESADKDYNKIIISLEALKDEVSQGDPLQIVDKALFYLYLTALNSFVDSNSFDKIHGLDLAKQLLMMNVLFIYSEFFDQKEEFVSNKIGLLQVDEDDFDFNDHKLVKKHLQKLRAAFEH